MKYIMFEDDRFIIIPDFMKHDEVKCGTPISAGFIQLQQYEYEYGGFGFRVICYGESISLNLKSRKKDSAIISKILKGG